MDLSPFLNLLPQLPFMPIAAFALSLIAIAFWDRLAKPLGLEQHRWICAATLAVASVLALAQAMHLSWEWPIKPMIAYVARWRRWKKRLGNLTNGEKALLTGFLEDPRLHLVEKRSMWVPGIAAEGFILGPRLPSDENSSWDRYDIDEELLVYLRKNLHLLKTIPKVKPASAQK